MSVVIAVCLGLLADLIRRPLFLAVGPPDAVLLAGVACCAVGIAGFLAAARWGPMALRPLWLALGCGADFGVNAPLLKIVPATLPAGFAGPLHQWPLYLIVIVTPVGFLLNQNAFQAGTLIAPARRRRPGTDRRDRRGHHPGPARTSGCPHAGFARTCSDRRQPGQH
jgi:hypothetical protein